MTGNTAAPTADTGPTTLIWPRASPRYSTRVPVPPARPLASPQAMARTLGPGPPAMISTAQASTVATASRHGNPHRAEAPRGQSPGEIGTAVQQGRGEAEQDSHDHPSVRYTSTLPAIGPDGRSSLMAETRTNSELLVVLRPDANVALHRQIETSIRDAIRAGRLARGSSLPPSRTLAADLGVSRGVVVEAYQQLTAEGYLASRAGGYTQVAAGPAVPPPRRARPASPGPPST